MPPRWRDYDHLLRLAALFAGGVIVFFASQAVLVPAGFGLYGHYRAGALEANRARSPAFAGEAACATCHADVVDTRAINQHRGVRCEACHGPLAKHSSEPAKVALPDAASLCVRCHAANNARPASFPQVIPSEHAGADACTSCHAAHAPRIE